MQMMDFMHTHPVHWWYHTRWWHPTRSFTLDHQSLCTWTEVRCNKARDKCKNNVPTEHTQVGWGHPLGRFASLGTAWLRRWCCIQLRQASWYKKARQPQPQNGKKSATSRAEGYTSLSTTGRSRG